MSEVPNVYACIAAVSADIAKTGIAKDGRNQQQGYAFRGIDSVYNALAPLIAKHGLVIIPRILTRSVVERQTAKGGTLFYVTVEAEFDFVSAADGSKCTARSFGEAMDSADKATNKAMSAAYKYTAFQTFCIPTEGDNDADAHTPDAIVAKAPAGYEDWLDTLAAAADNGPDAMKALWAQSKPEYRRHHAIVAKAPAGYEDWMDTLTAVADEGADALKAFWTGSKPEYRRHLKTTNNAKWEALKAKAVPVPVPV